MLFDYCAQNCNVRWTHADCRRTRLLDARRTAVVLSVRICHFRVLGDRSYRNFRLSPGARRATSVREVDWSAELLCEHGGDHRAGDDRISPGLDRQLCRDVSGRSCCHAHRRPRLGLRRGTFGTSYLFNSHSCTSNRRLTKGVRRKATDRIDDFTGIVGPRLLIAKAFQREEEPGYTESMILHRHTLT